MKTLSERRCEESNTYAYGYDGTAQIVCVQLNDEKTKWTIHWYGAGERTVGETKEYMALMNRAIDKARSLNYDMHWDKVEAEVNAKK